MEQVTRPSLRSRTGCGALVAVPMLILVAGCFGGSPAVSSKVAEAVEVDRVDVVCMGTLGDVDLRAASIADLQDALASGAITSVDLVLGYLARIEAFDRGGPRLNSVLALNPRAAAEAAALDVERQRGDVRGPLHGIPILLKDNVGTDDMPTTAGSIALAANVPPEDATLTARLREAGMVILGKLNLSEFAGWMSLYAGYSSLGGQTINAYTGGSPSGSSAGSGVAGSMSFAAITIGTDTMGSIMGPSDANSLVGMRGSHGLVSGAGVIPLARQFDAAGPMGRHVHDVARVLGAIAGPDPRDPFTAESGAHLPAGGDFTAALHPDALEGVRIGYDERSGNELFLRALDDLRRLGATLVPTTVPTAAGGLGASELVLVPNEFKFEINGYLAEEAGPGLPVETLRDIILYNQDHPDRVKYGQALLILSEATPGDPAFHDPLAPSVVAANRALAEALVADVDAVVAPGTPFSPIAAAAGYPEITVPIGYEGQSPQGMTFFGPRWSDADLLAYAYAFEQGSLRREAPEVVNPTLLDGVCAAA